MFKEHKKEIKRERSGKKRRPSKNNEWIKDMTTMETSSLSRCRDGVSASQSPLLSSAAVAASSFNEPTPNEWIIPLCRKAVSDNDKRSCGNCITLQRNPYLLGLLTIEIGWGTVMNGSLQCSSLMRSWTELTVWVSFFLFSSFLVGLGFWGFFFFWGFLAFLVSFFRVEFRVCVESIPMLWKTDHCWASACFLTSVGRLSDGRVTVGVGNAW